MKDIISHIATMPRMRYEELATSDDKNKAMTSRKSMRSSRSGFGASSRELTNQKRTLTPLAIYVKSRRHEYRRERQVSLICWRMKQQQPPTTAVLRKLPWPKRILSCVKFGNPCSRMHTNNPTRRRSPSPALWPKRKGSRLMNPYECIVSLLRNHSTV
jgi:hypothetical protein